MAANRAAGALRRVVAAVAACALAVPVAVAAAPMGPAAASTVPRTQMSFNGSGATTDQTIPASFEFSANGSAYQQFANVTPIVQAAGNG